jgi:hypothetical protein
MSHRLAGMNRPRVRSRHLSAQNHHSDGPIRRRTALSHPPDQSRDQNRDQSQSPNLPSPRLIALSALREEKEKKADPQGRTRSFEFCEDHMRRQTVSLEKGDPMNSIKRTVSLLTLALLSGSIVIGQDRTRTVYPPLPPNASVRATKPTDPTYIPAGSKVYVEDIAGLPGFENNLVAAFQKKQVNLLIVADRSLADFEVTGFAQSETAGWAKIIFGSGRPESEASIQLVNLRTGVIAYAVASYRVNSLNGNKSTAEHLAKNLRQKMERDERRLGK